MQFDNGGGSIRKVAGRIYFCYMLVKTLSLYEAKTGLDEMAQHANMNARHENIRREITQESVADAVRSRELLLCSCVSCSCHA